MIAAEVYGSSHDPSNRPASAEVLEGSATLSCSEPQLQSQPQPQSFPAPAFSGLANPAAYAPANAAAAAAAAINNHSAYFAQPSASAATQSYSSYVPDVVPQQQQQQQQDECGATQSQYLVNGPLGYQTLANRSHYLTHSPNPNLVLQQIQHSPSPQEAHHQHQHLCYQQSAPGGGTGTSPYHSGLSYSPSHANAISLQQQQFAQSHSALYEYSPPQPPPGLPLIHNHQSHGVPVGVVSMQQLSDGRFHTLPVQAPGVGTDPNLMLSVNMSAEQRSLLHDSAVAVGGLNGGAQLLAVNSSSSMNGPLIHAPNALSAGGSAGSLQQQQQQQPNVMDMNVNVNGTIARIRLVQFQRLSDEPLVRA